MNFPVRGTRKEQSIPEDARKLLKLFPGPYRFKFALLPNLRSGILCRDWLPQISYSLKLTKVWRRPQSGYRVGQNASAENSLHNAL